MSHHVPSPPGYDVVMTEQVSGPKEPKLLGRHMPSVPKAISSESPLFEVQGKQVLIDESYEVINELRNACVFYGLLWSDFL